MNITHEILYKRIIYNVYRFSFLLIYFTYFTERRARSRLSITPLYKYTRVFENFWQTRKERREKINILRQVQFIRGGRIYVDTHSLSRHTKENTYYFVASC